MSNLNKGTGILSVTLLAWMVACTAEPSPGTLPGVDAGVDDRPAPEDAPEDVATDRGVVPPTDTPVVDVTPDRPAACVDSDGDGYPTTECGGMPADCDDANNQVNPGRPEVCDATGRDEDCNPCTVAGAADGDGDRDTFLGAGCFNRYAGAAPTTCGPGVRIDGATLRVVGRDCDDTDNNVRPDQTETPCNGVDDNCNAMVDEGPQRTFYRDSDGDGFGDRTAPPRTACAPPTGYVEDNTDCDDTPTSGGAVNPSAREVCDDAMRDENCNGAMNEGCACVEGREYPCAEQRGRCMGSVQRCVANALGTCSYAPQAEACDGADNDCDGMTDEGLSQVCYTGPAMTVGRGVCHGGTQVCMAGVFGACAGQVIPTTEICDGLDNDCDGEVDEGAASSCTPPANSVATCSAGRCGSACSAGFGDCDGNAANGCEVGLSASTTHCGACGRGCAAGSICSGGTCSCPGGTVCGTTCRATQTDVNNCGGCGTVCPAPSGGSAGCTSGRCVQNCTTGYTNCSGSCQQLISCTNGLSGLCAASGTYVCSGAGRACNAPYAWPGRQTFSTGFGRSCSSSTIYGPGFTPPPTNPEYNCFFQYGPFTQLYAGSYTANFSISLAVPPIFSSQWVAFFLDVTEANGQTVLGSLGNALNPARCTQSSIVTECRFAVPFVVPSSSPCHSNIEFRVRYAASNLSVGSFVTVSAGNVTVDRM